MEILNSKISNVTVYSDRAQITRLAKVFLKKGQNTLIFNNLPSSVEEKSIQVKGDGDAVLNDIKFKQTYHVEIQNEAVAGLVDKLESLNKEISTLDESINIEQKELDFVEKIVTKTTSVAEKEKSEELDPEKWIKMVDFYRQKNENITKTIRELKYKKSELQKEVEVYKKEIAALGNNRSKTINQVEVIITNNSDGEMLLSLSYIVYGAYWSPIYDIRVSSENKSVVIEYKAQVIQHTGEKWEDVKLAISTAQVSVSGTMPELSVWRIGFYNPIPQPAPKVSMERKKSAKVSTSSNDAFALSTEISDTIVKPKAEVKTGATSVLFEIPTNCTILDDNQPHKVNILIEELSAEFTYGIVPKLSQYSYLKAKIKNTTDYPLLPGESNIFLDGSFVATSSLKLVAPTEEFETSLGVDEGVKVEHKLVKKYEKNKGLISKKSNIVFEYQTVISNNKKQKQNIILYNQLPISQHSDITVELIIPEYKEDNDNLKIDNEKKIEWLFELEAGDKKTIDFIFSVESPKDSVLEGI